MNAFIVRPFGIKNGVDFDKVDRELISKALEQLQITGRTTQEIARAGNIRADMFQLLLTADIVIADISIHNANVFYELGVRHAFRERRTFLLRAGMDEVPFDLKTDRFLAYDPVNPSASLQALIQALDETRRSSIIDSPVFSMLPGLPAPDPSAFMVIPATFTEEVNRARLDGTTGDLRFLASELTGLPWRREGLRVVGEAQFQAGDLKYAGETWEWVRSEIPDDVKANLRLGTIYQKAGDLVRSDEALQRVVQVKELGPEDEGEARALLGSNLKKRWFEGWEKLPEIGDRQAEALRSSLLIDSLEEYRRGFETDPRDYYAGLNALAMVTILTELAAAQPAVWQERFEDSLGAATELKQYTQLRSELCGAVEFSLRATKQRLQREGSTDAWLTLSFADYAFLLSKLNTTQLYREGLSQLGPFQLSVVRNQFEIFRALQIVTASVGAIASLFTTRPDPPSPQTRSKVLLFTGHRVDDPNRASPRFPPDKESLAREQILDAVKQEIGADRSAVAIAGGASGGDLLFHEVCEQLGVERRMYLIIPRDAYVTESVSPAGPDWIARFNHQYSTASVREYQRQKDLPDWLADKPNYDIWQRSNLWMMHNALALGGDDTTLIALWDGKGGDGPGGTEHMVQSVNHRGARAIVLDTKPLLGV